MTGNHASNREVTRTQIRRYADEGRLAVAFSEAARWGEFDLVREIHQKGLAIDEKSDNGNNALMHAASAGEVKILQYLLDHGADPNARDDERRRTALMWCFSALHSDKVYLLVATLLHNAGADVTLVDSEGVTALDLARARNRPRLDEWVDSVSRQ